MAAREDAVNEFIIKESGVTITVTVTVSGDGNNGHDRQRVEFYGEELANKMFVKSVKKFTPRRVMFTRTDHRELL